MQIGIDLGATKIEYVLLDNNNIELKRDRVQTPKDYEKTIISITEIVKKLESTGEAEVNSEYIGSLVMKSLLLLDKVGYIRYASVYKNFVEGSDFEDFINELRS